MQQPFSIQGFLFFKGGKMKEDYKIIFEDLKNLNLKSLTAKETEKIRSLNINTLHDLLYF